MKLKKGDKFVDYLGNPCFISYIRGDVVKITYPNDGGRVDVWDKLEFISNIDRFKFFPQHKEPINRINITEHLIEYELNMVGKTINEAKSDPTWYSTNTFTRSQYEVFKSYAIPLLRKVFKFNKKKAEETFGWFDIQYGLRVKD